MHCMRAPSKACMSAVAKAATADNLTQAVYTYGSGPAQTTTSLRHTEAHRRGNRVSHETTRTARRNQDLPMLSLACAWFLTCGNWHLNPSVASAFMSSCCMDISQGGHCQTEHAGRREF